MLGLTRTAETQALVCESDPAIGGDEDTWRAPSNGEASSATVIEVHALSTLEIVRVLPGLRAMDPTDTGTEATLQAFLGVCRAGFVRATEGGTVTTEPGCLEYLTVGQVVGLGSWLLSESQAPTDPTEAGGSA